MHRQTAKNEMPGVKLVLAKIQLMRIICHSATRLLSDRSWIVHWSEVAELCCRP